jgi:opacity protein-like surface antigen
VNLLTPIRCGLVLLLAASAANAAEPASVWDWTGFYLGAHGGGMLGQSDVADPYGRSIYGDTVRTPGVLFGAQAGYNWQAAGSRLIYGLEGDLSALDGEGTATCFAFSGRFTSSNCRARPDFAATIAGRLGYAGGSDGRTLYFLKAGGAVLHNRIDATTNFGFGVFPIRTVGTTATSLGWTIGAGVERAVTPAWSVKLEYDYLDFADASFTTRRGFLTTPGGIFTVVPSANVGVDQSVHMVKLGLNYRFGADPIAKWRDPPTTTAVSGWAFETAARYWVSSGRFQKDLPAFTNSKTSLISRLTYDGLSAQSGEAFGRLDSPWQFFLKGFAGLGRVDGGKLHDEDWGLFPTGAPFTSYSNTVSNLTDTKLHYGVIDAGYDFLTTPDFKLGGFIGYTKIHEQYAANDCRQIASPSAGICTPPITGVPVITETDTWSSLRLGLAAEFWLLPQLKLVADAAYLPNVSFKGVDNHWLRQLVIDENGRGQGTQLEAILSYYITPNFSVGAGARYWAMWTRTGADAFNGVPIRRPDTYRYERYGMLLQAAYNFH